MGIIDNETIKKSKLLLVGAGGIGCELLKNIVLSGFSHITIIDLDTIDISNLNRQFLFRKEHVGKSKAMVAKESALSLNPNIHVVAHHDSIMSQHYGMDYFRQFDIILNALDNRAARSHVNRMCLAADIPLIESGSAGYLGQVTLIKKKLTECYDCQPKEAQKTFPGCTIRNTPSEYIHCVVWAKHLFNQLFGETDPDQDVSPDTEDPEAAGDAGKNAITADSKKDSIGGIERISTRIWANENNYDAIKLFNKFFCDDIKYLLSMSNLWKQRTAPIPLDIHNLPILNNNENHQTTTNENVLKDQQSWSIQECYQFFKKSLNELNDNLKSGGQGSTLVWDKDNESAMNFVTSTANLRAFLFGIHGQSLFNTKSMAGNIIPAIATTNAVVAGLIVLEAFKVLANRIDLCKAVYINRQPNFRKKLLLPCCLEPPNPKCYVCSDKHEISIKLDVKTFVVKSLEDKILKGTLGMVAPDVEIDDGKGTILISSEEGETEDNWSKSLSDFGITNSSRLKCDDFLQEYNLIINIIAVDSKELGKDKEFELIGDLSELQKDIHSSNNLDNNVDQNTGTTSNINNESTITEDFDEVQCLDDIDDIEVTEIETNKQNGKEDSSVNRKRKLEENDLVEHDYQIPIKKKFNEDETNSNKIKEGIMIIE